MNNLEKLILLLAAIVLALIILFPPWIGAHAAKPELLIHLPRSFVLSPPRSPGTISIDWRELTIEIFLTLIPVFLLNMAARWLFTADMGPPGWPGTSGPVPAAFYRLQANPAPQHLVWFPVGCPDPRFFVLVATSAAQQDRPVSVAYARLKNRQRDLWNWTVGGGEAGTAVGLPQAMQAVQAALAKLQLNVAATPLVRSLNGLSLPVQRGPAWLHHLRFSVSILGFVLRFVSTLIWPARSRRTPTASL